MRNFVALCLLALFAVPAQAGAAWYARGDWNVNGFDDLTNPMTDQGFGHYTTTITGLTAGNDYEYKIAREDWSAFAPGSNGKVTADANGEIFFHFWENDTWADGWEPSAKMRVGYNDHGLYDWEIAGSMNGWSGGDLLTDQGSGLHTGTITLNAGSYDFKFRKQGDWAIAIGDDFGNSAANNSITVDNDGDVWAFELDLPNGAWRTYQVPEPGTLMLAGLGVMGLLVGSLRKRWG